MLFLLQTYIFRSVHSGSWHEVYSGYIPCTVKESPVLPWFFREAGISGTHSHFSELQMRLPPESNGSFGTEFPFHLGYFHRIPDVSL